MVPAPAKPSSTSFMTLAVFWTSLSMKSLAVKIGVVPPTMFGSWVGSSAAGLPNTAAVLADLTYAQRTWFLSRVSVTGSEYSCTPGVEPLGALSAPPKEPVLPDWYGVVPPLMRACDSSTATATGSAVAPPVFTSGAIADRSEEHTSELQSLRHLVCRLLLEKKK